MFPKTKSLIFSLVVFSTQISAEFLGNKYDPFYLSSYKCISGQINFAESKKTPKQGFFSFSITPVYHSSNLAWDRGQSSTSKYGPDANKLTYGPLEENGFWNANGLFYGFADPNFIDTANKLEHPAGTHILKSLYYAPKGTYLTKLATNTGIGALPEDNYLINPSNWTDSNFGNYYKGFLRVVHPNISEQDLMNLSQESDNPATLPAVTIPTDNLKKYLMSKDVIGFSTPGDNDNANGLLRLGSNIEKKAIRAHVQANIFDGISIVAKGGFAELSVLAKDFKSLSTTSNTSPVTADTGLLKNVMECLDYTLKDYLHSGLEDTYVGLNAGQSLDLRDSDGDLIARLFPYISGGLWMPTSKNYNDAHGHKYALYVPLGNEGHTGFNGHIGVSIEMTESFCLTGGAGIIVFNEINIKNFRMPNDQNQVGLYPFVIDVKRKLGKQLYAFGSLKAMDIETATNFYADVYWVSHAKDAITLLDPSENRNKAFETGKTIFEERSKWSTVNLNAGLSIAISDDVVLGGGFSTNIYGKSTSRNKTIVGNVSIIF